MTISPHALLNRVFEPVEHEYFERDAILYALALGFGEDPLDSRQLGFVYEVGLQVLPTFAVILGSPGFWYRDPEFGIDWKRMLHGEQRLELFEPLPPKAKVVGMTRIANLVDRGPEKGALLFVERRIVTADDRRLLARSTATMVLRGDGGFGLTGAVPSRPRMTIPDRQPDAIVKQRTLRQSALIYRLSGDRNPLHADPAVARAAGFERPILHGLCTFGMIGRAIVECACDFVSSRLSEISVRFTTPVYPGETIETELWIDRLDITFRARAMERGVVVADGGTASLRR